MAFQRRPKPPQKQVSACQKSGRRTMDAKPRLPLARTSQHSKAGRCKRLLCPAATSSTVGSGGHDGTESPATKSNTALATSSAKPSVQQGARGYGKQKRVGFATTHPVATKRNASSTNGVTSSRRCQRIKSQSGSGRRNGPRCEPTKPQRVRWPSSRKIQSRQSTPSIEKYGTA